MTTNNNVPAVAHNGGGATPVAIAGDATDTNIMSAIEALAASFNHNAFDDVSYILDVSREANGNMRSRLEYRAVKHR